MEAAEDFGKSWLGLGIGGGDLKRSHGERRSAVRLDLLFPQQSVKEEEAAVGSTKAEKGARKRLKITDDDGVGRRSLEPSPSDDGGAGARKKLRLTKEQSTLLEDTFRAHNILSHVSMCSIYLVSSATLVASTCVRLLTYSS
jgi:hypothetical protein